MLKTLWILVTTATVGWCELFGDNVCEVEERYPVNVTEYTLRNATVRNYKWCMGFPPRCSFYTFKTIRVPQIVESSGSRIVKSCCPGYAENLSSNACVKCEKCLEGTCGKDGKCICNSGFYGENCADACKPMLWGPYCGFECFCERGTCNPRTGRCDCPAGWFGPRCELLCLEGFHGKHCIHRCRCGERELCDPETGECSKKPTRTQEHQSTRAIHYMTEDVMNITQTIHMQKSSPSLKIYHTFDSELDSQTPSYNTKSFQLTTDKINTKLYENSKVNIDNKLLLTKRPLKSTTSSTRSQQHNTKISSRKTETIKFKISNEESLESTTETSAEKPKSEDNYLFINENGSIEKKDKNSKEYNIQESMKNVPSIYANNKSKEKSIEPSKEKKVNKSTLRTTTVTSTQSSKIHSIKISDKTSKISKDSTIYKISGNFTQTTLRKSTSKKNHNIPTISSVQKERTSSHNENRNISRISVLNKNKFKPKETPTMKTTKIKKLKLTTEYPHALTTEIPFYSSTTTKDMRKTMNMKNNEYNIEPKVPPKNFEKLGISNNYRVMEEDQLQNLDRLNILTSQETSSPIPGPTVGLGDFRKAIIPLTDSIRSTKSFLEDAGKHLTTPEYFENRIPLKEAYDSGRGKEENYFSDEASGESEFSATKENFPSAMSIIAIVSFVLVVITCLLVFAHHYSRKKKRLDSKAKGEKENYSGRPTVSVYTHSIFHTPLPDPPTFENPVFKSPTETSGERTFQTHVVCSLNFPNNHCPENKEYTYDHPPSTGSYRAASIPEPPDLAEMSPPEPLYDEIPSNGKTTVTSPPPSYKSSCIYVNTCGKTKF